MSLSIAFLCNSSITPGIADCVTKEACERDRKRITQLEESEAKLKFEVSRLKVRTKYWLFFIYSLILPHTYAY